MSYNKLGFTSGQTLKAEHLNYIEDGIANAGGVSSWNDLEDKPFGAEQAFEPIVLPDMIDNSVSFDFGQLFNLESLIFRKVNTPVFDTDALVGASFTLGGVSHRDITKIDSAVDFAEVYGVELNDYDENGDGIHDDMAHRWTFYVAAVRQENAYGVPVGVYVSDVVMWNGGIGTFDATIIIHKETIKTLDEKYLPESVEGVVVRSSAADSTKKFKITVDDSGTITATEVTD